MNNLAFGKKGTGHPEHFPSDCASRSNFPRSASQEGLVWKPGEGTASTHPSPHRHSNGTSSHSCAAGGVRTICHSRADEGRLSGASAPKPAQKHFQRGFSKSPTMLQSPRGVSIKVSKEQFAPSLLLHPQDCSAKASKVVPKHSQIPHLPKHWRKACGAPRINEHSTRNTVLQNAAQEHKRQKIKTPTSPACYEHP